MKLLLFSDLHTDAQRAKGIVGRASEFDVLVGAGDVAVQFRAVDLTV